MFFTDGNLAEAAGFRACKRCRPDTTTRFVDPDAQRVASACEMLHQLSIEAPIPTLEKLAMAVGLSKYHFHRLFKRETGLTPKDYLLECRSSVPSGSSSGSARTPVSSDHSGDSPAGALQSGHPSPSEFAFEIDKAPVHYSIVDSSRGRLIAAFQQQFVSWTAEDVADVALMEMFEAAFPAIFYDHIPVAAADVNEAELMAGQLRALVGHQESALSKPVMPV